MHQALPEFLVLTSSLCVLSQALTSSSKSGLQLCTLSLFYEFVFQYGSSTFPTGAVCLSDPTRLAFEILPNRGVRFVARTLPRKPKRRLSGRSPCQLRLDERTKSLIAGTCGLSTERKANLWTAPNKLSYVTSLDYITLIMSRN